MASSSLIPSRKPRGEICWWIHPRSMVVLQCLFSVLMRNQARHLQKLQFYCMGMYFVSVNNINKVLQFHIPLCSVFLLQLFLVRTPRCPRSVDYFVVQDITKALHNANKGPRKNKDMDKFIGKVNLPYILGTTDKIPHILKRNNIMATFKPLNTIHNYLILLKITLTISDRRVFI